MLSTPSACATTLATLRIEGDGPAYEYVLADRHYSEKELKVRLAEFAQLDVQLHVLCEMTLPIRVLRDTLAIVASSGVRKVTVYFVDDTTQVEVQGILKSGPNTFEVMLEEEK